MIKIEAGLSKENEEVLFSDESIQKLSRDGVPVSKIDHPCVKYYSAFVSGEFVGAFMIINNTRLDSEIHLLLLPISVKYYRYLCVLIINEAFLTAHRVTAKIYSHLKTIQNLVKKLGFSYEGTIRESFELNGKVMDIQIYGLLKSEWRSK
ncbi:MAG: GNAT family protein [Bdellovibrionales bacterium]|jgi:3-phosphoglycerate kinase